MTSNIAGIPADVKAEDYRNLGSMVSALTPSIVCEFERGEQRDMHPNLRADSRDQRHAKEKC